MTEVTVGTPPTVRSLFGGVSLANAITPTQIWNTALASLSDHAVLFASYVQGKHVEPKPSADELSSEVKYRNWLSRNLKALTQNYIAHSLSTYLDEALVTQAVNETVTEYATNYETQKTTPLATAQLQTAAVSLRQCLPQSYGSSNINNSWMRLMAGK